MQKQNHQTIDLGTAILGTGICLAQRKISAEQIDELTKQPKGWTRAHTGVINRYFVAEGQTAITMGAEASQHALNNAGMELGEIDCLISASGTSAQPLPSTASLILHQLDPKSKHSLASFHVDCTCLSFIAALDIANQFVQTGRFRRILIVSSEAGSTGLNWSQAESAALIGDGAAAVIVGAQDQTELKKAYIQTSKLRTYPEGAKFAQIKGGGSKLPAWKIEDSNHSDYLFDMNGPRVMKMAAKHLPLFCKELFADSQLVWEDFNWVIPHQASTPALAIMQRRLKIPQNKFFINVQDVGNTIAASIPIALHQGITSGQIQRGMKLLLIGTSAGFCIGATILTY